MLLCSIFSGISTLIGFIRDEARTPSTGLGFIFSYSLGFLCSLSPCIQFLRDRRRLGRLRHDGRSLGTGKVLIDLILFLLAAYLYKLFDTLIEQGIGSTTAFSEFLSDFIERSKPLLRLSQYSIEELFLHPVINCMKLKLSLVLNKEFGYRVRDSICTIACSAFRSACFTSIASCAFTCLCRGFGCCSNT